MRKNKRNLGSEILEGICEIKRGRHGRVVKVSSISSARKKSGLRKS